MKFSYNLISEYLSKKPPEAHKLAELLTLHSFEVEGVEKVGSDYVLDIDILPNRAHDAASHIGVARDVAAILNHGHAGAAKKGIKLKQKKHSQLKTKKNAVKGLQVEVQRQALCPRYMGAVMRGVKVKPSPVWLKKRLEALGINSINNIVDAANYAMLITGQPLHVFDYDKVAGKRGRKKIIVRSAGKKETIDTLDEQAFILDNSVLVIADSEGPLAIAGVKGGKKAEVTEETTDIILESAHFDPLAIRQATKLLGLNTDASWRFEHEVPVSFVPQGIQVLADLIRQLAGGKMDSEVVDTLKNEPEKRVVGIRPSYIKRLLGVAIDKKHVKGILSALGFEITNKSGDLLEVTVPPFRLDIKREEDIIEEVVRLFGYRNIEPKMPAAALYGAQFNPKNSWLRHIRRYLASRGASEVQTYAFISKELLSAWRYEKRSLWEPVNPVSEEYAFLTPSLLPQMVRVANENLKFADSVYIFESGNVFQKSRIKSQREVSRLGLVLASKHSDKDGFYRLKGELFDMLYGMGITDAWLDDVLTDKEEKELGFLHPTRRAVVKSGNNRVGVFGQLHPRTAHEANSTEGAFVAELDIEKLAELAEDEEEYRPHSIFPHIVRDLSVIVPKYTKATDVMEIIDNAGGSLLVDVDLFDYYEEIENEEAISMTFRLVFQAQDRTLKSKEVDGLMAKIKAAAQEQNWEIR